MESEIVRRKSFLDDHNKSIVFQTSEAITNTAANPKRRTSVSLNSSGQIVVSSQTSKYDAAERNILKSILGRIFNNWYLNWKALKHSRLRIEHHIFHGWKLFVKIEKENKINSILKQKTQTTTPNNSMKKKVTIVEPSAVEPKLTIKTVRKSSVKSVTKSKDKEALTQPTEQPKFHLDPPKIPTPVITSLATSLATIHNKIKIVTSDAKFTSSTTPSSNSLPKRRGSVANNPNIKGVGRGSPSRDGQSAHSPSSKTLGGPLAHSPVLARTLSECRMVTSSSISDTDASYNNTSSTTSAANTALTIEPFPSFDAEPSSDRSALSMSVQTNNTVNADDFSDLQPVRTAARPKESPLGKLAARKLQQLQQKHAQSKLDITASDSSSHVVLPAITKSEDLLPPPPPPVDESSTQSPLPLEQQPSIYKHAQRGSFALGHNKLQEALQRLKEKSLSGHSLNTLDGAAAVEMEETQTISVAVDEQFDDIPLPPPPDDEEEEEEEEGEGEGDEQFEEDCEVVEEEALDFGSPQQIVMDRRRDLLGDANDAAHVVTHHTEEARSESDDEEEESIHSHNSSPRSHSDSDAEVEADDLSALDLLDMSHFEEGEEGEEGENQLVQDEDELAAESDGDGEVEDIADGLQSHGVDDDDDQVHTLDAGDEEEAPHREEELLSVDEATAANEPHTEEPSVVFPDNESTEGKEVDHDDTPPVAELDSALQLSEMSLKVEEIMMVAEVSDVQVKTFDEKQLLRTAAAHCNHRRLQKGLSVWKLRRHHRPPQHVIDSTHLTGMRFKRFLRCVAFSTACIVRTHRTTRIGGEHHNDRQCHLVFHSLMLKVERRKQGVNATQHHKVKTSYSLLNKLTLIVDRKHVQQLESQSETQYDLFKEHPADANATPSPPRLDDSDSSAEYQNDTFESEEQEEVRDEEADKDEPPPLPMESFCEEEGDDNQPVETNASQWSNDSHDVVSHKASVVSSYHELFSPDEQEQHDELWTAEDVITSDEVVDISCIQADTSIADMSVNLVGPLEDISQDDGDLEVMPPPPLCEDTEQSHDVSAFKLDLTLSRVDEEGDDVNLMSNLSGVDIDTSFELVEPAAADEHQDSDVESENHDSEEEDSDDGTRYTEWLAEQIRQEESGGEAAAGEVHVAWATADDVTEDPPPPDDTDVDTDSSRDNDSDSDLRAITHHITLCQAMCIYRLNQRAVNRLINSELDSIADERHRLFVLHAAVEAFKDRRRRRLEKRNRVKKEMSAAESQSIQQHPSVKNPSLVATQVHSSRRRDML